MAMTRFFTIDYQPIPGADAAMTLTDAGDGWYDLCIRANLPHAVPIGDWQLHVRPAFQPDFYYTPHLTPTDDHVVDMHVFRTPAVMMGQKDLVLCLLPVMDGVTRQEERYYLDLDAPRNVMTLGITTTRVAEHILYRRTGSVVLPAGEFLCRARLLLLQGEAAANPFRAVLAYYWQRYGQQDIRLLPAMDQLMPYVRHTYTWAFENWKDVVWQEFNLNGRRVGAPQMIVITRQSPNYGKPCSLREDVSIWNQAWFCSLRSAQGLYRYGQETGNAEYLRKARLTKELALSFPQEDGLFDAVIAVPCRTRVVDGEEYTCGGSWEDCYFGNSNRNPVTWDLRRSPRHILDMNWTALHMLSWYEELEQDERLKDYVIRYADRLLRLQDAEGFFPAWLDREDGHVLSHLQKSPECAVSVTLLMSLARLTGRAAYREAALRCMEALIREVMPDSRWEDFETYWSCSRFGADMEGQKYPRNASYKQCSLSPFYMAQALLSCWEGTEDRRYLTLGQRCLDEMLMYQSSFQPDYMPITVIGGFGVMNGDAELNDARQSMFAELILRYGRALDLPEYIQRGKAALQASFSMMYCPENPLAREQWEKRWPFLNERDYGFMMENYGHSGTVNGSDLGIGEFTIYDWGNGAASEAVMRIRAHFPDL